MRVIVERSWAIFRKLFSKSSSQIWNISKTLRVYSFEMHCRWKLTGEARSNGSWKTSGGNNVSRVFFNFLIFIFLIFFLGAVRKYRCFFRDDIGASGGGGGGGGGLSHVRLFEHQKNIDVNIWSFADPCTRTSKWLYKKCETSFRSRS